MLVQRRQDHDRLLHLEGRADVAHDLPAVDLAPGHRDDHLHHVGLGALQQDQAEAPVDRDVLAGVDGAHHLLGRFAQADIGEAQGLVGDVGPAAGEDDLAGGDDLVPGRGVPAGAGSVAAGEEGMSGRCYAPPRDDPLRSPHGGCRRPGGAQRPGTGPPPGDRPPRRPRAARQRALRAGRGPGRRRGIRSRSTPCPSSRPIRREGTGPTAWSVELRRPPAPRPGRAVPPVRGPDARRGRPSPADGHRRRLPHRHPHRRRRGHPGRPRHRDRSWSSRTT